MILQTPDDMGDPPPEKDGWYSYLMQFMDGNRIDLSFHPLDSVSRIREDSLSVVLLDKDHLIGVLPPSSDLSYYPVKPTSKAFDDCCNEFWWLNSYAAKGLWRGELTYARNHLDTWMREQLMKMLEWYFGMKTDFKKSPGKNGKYLRDGIGEDLWKAVEKTYSDDDLNHNWTALFAMDDLFRRIAWEVASQFGFTYPMQEDQRVTDFVHRIKDLPRDAVEI
jgi:aminoglycoside 6-adenylyltransferase